MMDLGVKTVLASHLEARGKTRVIDTFWTSSILSRCIDYTLKLQAKSILLHLEACNLLIVKGKIKLFIVRLVPFITALLE
jgi:hypothetical protein